MFRNTMLRRCCTSKNVMRCYSKDLTKAVTEALSHRPDKEGFELIVDLKREGRSRTELAQARKVSVTGKPFEEKIIYNSFIEKHSERVGYIQMLKMEQERIITERRRLLESQATSVVAQMMVSSETKNVEEPKVDISDENEEVTFPFQSFTQINETRLKTRRKSYETSVVADSKLELPEGWLADYGTADPNIPASDVPCGGCGANLHCKDSGVPGFIPSETFRVLTRRELYRHLCQRCFFLREYNMALKVSVSPEDYVKVISEIRNKVALVMLVADILDFPSSIWPGLLDIIGRKRPVCLIGNKVDLVPLDGPGCLERMKKSLAESAQLAGLDKANLKHVALVSAKTGFGIEELITKLWSSWKNKGDIYILGCTNVGKSSLFNALLQSDLCKVDASDLIDRATTSVWPGTTLNLLKFPLASPSAIRVYERTQRLVAERRERQIEVELQKEQVKNTQNPIYASLMGKIGRTFLSKRRKMELEAGSSDPFSVGSTTIPQSGDNRPVFNPDDPTEANPRFCLDTPGTVHEDQVLTLLTMKELDLVVPRELIAPRSFLIRPGMTFFLAGLGRIDFLEGNHHIILTVFSSKHLPITILPTSEADSFFTEAKNTPLIAVPTGNEERMKLWPGMDYREFDLKGVWWEESLADITLSSAGWVAVTLGPRKQAKLRVGTPEGRGIYLRKPPLLPKAVELKGTKIRASPAYRPHRLVFGH